MAQESIPSGSPSLIHPITGSYMYPDENGNIRIGTVEFGDAIFIDGLDGQVYIRASKLRVICDELEWNELVFNKAAVNPTQATFTKKKANTASQEVSNYAS